MAPATFVAEAIKADCPMPAPTPRPGDLEGALDIVVAINDAVINAFREQHLNQHERVANETAPMAQLRFSFTPPFALPLGSFARLFAPTWPNYFILRPRSG